MTSRIISPPQGASQTTDPSIARLRALGVVLVPAPRGIKGTTRTGWTTADGLTLTREALASVARGGNIAYRGGQTVDGSRILGHLDLDHPAPGDLDRLCDALGWDAPVIESSPGRYRIFGWFPSEVPDGILAEMPGVEVAANAGRLGMLPPSIHPDGHAYCWQVEPGDDLPVIDLDVLGLTWAPKPGAASKSTARSAAKPLRSASTDVQREFADRFATIGIVEGAGTRRGKYEMFGSPWRDEHHASLEVHWPAAKWNDFGDGGGRRGLVELRERLGVHVVHRDHDRGAAVRREQDPPRRDDDRARMVTVLGEMEASEYADMLPPAPGSGWGRNRDPHASSTNGWSRHVAECRKRALTARADCPEGAGRAFAGKRAILASCHFALDPTCAPLTLKADAYKADAILDAQSIALVDLYDLTLPAFTFGAPRIMPQINAWLAEWRKQRGLEAGSITRMLDVTRDGLQPRVLLALPVGSEPPTDGRRVTVRLVQRVATLDEWHDAQGAMLSASIRSVLDAEDPPEALIALLSATRGARLFGHFGGWRKVYTSRDATITEAPPKTSGGRGSGRGTKVALPCPWCGKGHEVAGSTHVDRLREVAGVWVPVASPVPGAAPPPPGPPRTRSLFDAA